MMEEGKGTVSGISKVKIWLQACEWNENGSELLSCLCTCNPSPLNLAAVFQKKKWQCLATCRKAFVCHVDNRCPFVYQ